MPKQAIDIKPLSAVRSTSFGALPTCIFENPYGHCQLIVYLRAIPTGEQNDMEDQDLLALTADIVAAMVSNNKVAASELPDLIASVHTALGNTGKPVEVEQPKQEPAVSVRSSIKHDYIVCLEDGAKLKMLKRYLMTNYQMTPADYREKWGLPKDYPMVAPAYAETRRALAVSIGLGRKQADILLSEPSAVIPKAKAGNKKLGIAGAKAAAAEHLTGTAKPKKAGRPAKAAPEPTEQVEDAPQEG